VYFCSRKTSEDTVIEAIKMDVAVPDPPPAQHPDEQEEAKLHLTRTNSTALTELSRTVTMTPYECWRSITATNPTHSVVKPKQSRTDPRITMPSPPKTQSQADDGSSANDGIYK
jgi:hypothetical protein